MTTPPTTSPLPSSSAKPRRISGPNDIWATSLSRIGVPFVHPQTDGIEVFYRTDVASTAHHVFCATKLNRTPTHIVVTHPDSIHYCLYGNPVSRELVGIHINLILLDEPP